MNVERMVLLGEYDNISQAEMVKGLLDEAGVWSMINNEYMSAIYPTGIMPLQLIVAEHDLNRAKRVIDATSAPVSDDESAEMYIS